MFTIKIKTVSTKKFVWNHSAQRVLHHSAHTTLHGATVEAIKDFRNYVRGEGSQEGIHACLVTWEDGDDLHAFIFRQDTEIPIELPWTLMHDRPQQVLRGTSTGP